MKTLLLACWLSSFALSAFAQGTFEYRGTVLGCEGAGCSGQLYWGPAGIIDPLSDQLLAFGTSFSIPLSGQYSGTAMLTVPAPGQAVTLQARAWMVGTGSSWETATARGVSNPIQVILAPGPAPIVMFPTFSVPEPSWFAVGGLGLLVAFLSARRRVAQTNGRPASHTAV